MIHALDVGTFRSWHSRGPRAYRRAHHRLVPSREASDRSVNRFSSYSVPAASRLRQARRRSVRRRRSVGDRFDEVDCDSRPGESDPGSSDDVETSRLPRRSREPPTTASVRAYGRRERSCRRASGSAARQNKALARRVTPPRPPSPRSLAHRRSLARAPLESGDPAVHQRRSAFVDGRFVTVALPHPGGISDGVVVVVVEIRSRRPDEGGRGIENTAPTRAGTTQTMLRRAHCQSMRRGGRAEQRHSDFPRLLFHDDGQSGNVYSASVRSFATAVLG